MKRGMRAFARAVRAGKSDEAREMLDKIVQGEMDEGMWRGYCRSLDGIMKALKSGEDLTLPRQLVEDEFSFEDLDRLRDVVEKRSSQNFRSKEERGFNAAWADVLRIIVEDVNSK